MSIDDSRHANPLRNRAGRPKAAEQLLPLVYSELRKLAAQKMARENPGQTLEATALVHEAYPRLVDGDRVQHWNSRGHFFAAAAEAMRRILIEQARRKAGPKAGGRHRRIPLAEIAPAEQGPDIDLLALDEALRRLEKKDLRKADLAKLRFFAGLATKQAASMLGISPRAGLHGRAGPARPPRRRSQSDKTGDGHPAGDRTV